LLDDVLELEDLLDEVVVLLVFVDLVVADDEEAPVSFDEVPVAAVCVAVVLFDVAVSLDGAFADVFAAAKILAVEICPQPVVNVNMLVITAHNVKNIFFLICFLHMFYL